MIDWDQYEPAPDLLKNRVILVTGATSGIGRAVARDLVRHGATVVVHGRNAAALETLYEELKDLGPEPVAAELDLERAQGDEYQHLRSSLPTLPLAPIRSR